MPCEILTFMLGTSLTFNQAGCPVFASKFNYCSTLLSGKLLMLALKQQGKDLNLHLWERHTHRGGMLICRSTNVSTCKVRRVILALNKDWIPSHHLLLPWCHHRCSFCGASRATNTTSTAHLLLLLPQAVQEQYLSLAHLHLVGVRKLVNVVLATFWRQFREELHFLCHLL